MRFRSRHVRGLNIGKHGSLPNKQQKIRLQRQGGDAYHGGVLYPLLSGYDKVSVFDVRVFVIERFASQIVGRNLLRDIIWRSSRLEMSLSAFSHAARLCAAPNPV
jgi:hypothetical protein